MQTKEVAEKIVGPLGELEKVEIGDKGFNMGKYLQVCIIVDISKPLCKGRSVRMGGAKRGWVDFRYEHLPIFYYWCGVLEHDDRDCPLWIGNKESLGMEDKQFGPWLQADTERLQWPYVAKIPQRRTCDEGGSNQKASPHHTHPKKTTQKALSAKKKQNDEHKELPSTALVNSTNRVINEFMPQKNPSEDFEEQLQEIDQAINAVDILKDNSNLQAHSGGSTTLPAVKNFGQRTDKGVGSKDKAQMLQRTSPYNLSKSCDPYGLVFSQQEAHKDVEIVQVGDE